jgi:hypothetical protein
MRVYTLHRLILFIPSYIPLEPVSHTSNPATAAQQVSTSPPIPPAPHIHPMTNQLLVNRTHPAETRSCHDGEVSPAAPFLVLESGPAREGADGEIKARLRGTAANATRLDDGTDHARRYCRGLRWSVVVDCFVVCWSSCPSTQHECRRVVCIRTSYSAHSHNRVKSEKEVVVVVVVVVVCDLRNRNSFPVNRRCP